MAQKTVYVKESDLPLWESLSGESISAIVVDCLKKRKAQDEERTAASDKIVWWFWDANHDLTAKRSFYGQYLVGSDNEGVRTEDDTQDWVRGAEWRVALTKKGKIAVYVADCNGEWAPSMKVFDSFEEFKDEEDSQGNPTYPSDVIAMVASAMDEDYEEELDI